VISRREVVTGGLWAGTLEQGRTDRSSAADEQVAKALGEIRDELKSMHNPCGGADCSAVESVRTQQRAFLKAHGKYPDFIEVGVDIWDRLTDWHVFNRRPIEVSRMSDGRYGMTFMLTTLVLRHDMMGGYVGQGYDR